VVVDVIGQPAEEATPMRVEDVMTREIQTVSPEASAEDAWGLMRTRGVRHLVVAEGHRIVGILSDRDAGGTRGASIRKNQTVRDLMTSPVVTVPPATTIRQAANVMRGRSIGCLVVADRTGTKGIVTVADLLDLLGRGMERTVMSSTRRLLQHRVPHRKQHRGAAAW
jgi:acetoin utilization protein AcuB